MATSSPVENSTNEQFSVVELGFREKNETFCEKKATLRMIQIIVYEVYMDSKLALKQRYILVSAAP